MKQLELITYYRKNEFTSEKAITEFMNSDKYDAKCQYAIQLEQGIKSMWWNIYKII